MTTSREVVLENKLGPIFKSIGTKCGFELHQAMIKNKACDVLRPLSPLAPGRLLSISSQKSGRDVFMKVRPFPARTIQRAVDEEVRSLEPFDSRFASDHEVFRRAEELLGSSAATKDATGTFPAWHLRNLIDKKLLDDGDPRLRDGAYVVTEAPLALFDIIMIPIRRKGWGGMRITTHYSATVRYAYQWQTREATGQRFHPAFDLLIPGAIVPPAVLERHEQAAVLAPPVTGRATPRQRRSGGTVAAAAPPPNPSHIANAGDAVPADELVPGKTVCMYFVVAGARFAFKGVVRGGGRGGRVRVVFADGARFDCQPLRLLAVM